MKMQQIIEYAIDRKYFIHASVIDTIGFDLNVELSTEKIEEILNNINKQVENIATALDEWRLENEDQFDEDSEDFNNWIGDTLEVQESIQDCRIELEDLLEND